MPIILGTTHAIHRTTLDPDTPLEQVLDSGDALNVHTYHDGTYAATRSGLYRSTDAGRSWTNLDVPRREVFSTAASPTGERLYAGTHPAHLYATNDRGETWHELDALQHQPSRDTWHTPRHRDAAHVRTLATHPDAPHRLVAGIEVGGIHVSDDDGHTWTERRPGPAHHRDDDLHNDVHHVLMTRPDTLYAACGYGLYRTHDAGRTWTRHDPPTQHRYFHATHRHDDTLYIAAEAFPPGPYGRDTNPDGMLFASTDHADTLEPAPYPGAPQEVPTALATLDDRLILGTSQGRLLTLEEDTWEQIAQAPHWIRSIAPA